MRILRILFAFLALLIAGVAAWEKEDHEIFDIVSELEAAEGKGTTFYSWLDVPSTATTAEIAKAYRKKSMQLHPDKNPNVKGIHERFARLGVVSTILRNAESRKRYDFFYKNGVPKWRGTGYYYSRFRPGLGFVAAFLTILTSGLQYLVQGMNYKRDLARVELIVGRARAAAWGPKMIPHTGQRKVRVPLGESFNEDGDYAGNKSIDMVVEGTQVYLYDEAGDLTPLDSSTAVPPAISRTWAISLARSLFHKLTGKKETEVSAAAEDLPSTDKEGFDVESDDAASSDATSTRSGASAPAAKAGGMRRKALKKRK